MAQEKIFFHHDLHVRTEAAAKGVNDPHSIHFHLTPPRPAYLGQTLDPVTKEVNVIPGTLGPLTRWPYCLCLHINRSASWDTYHNLKNGAKECVVSIPGWDIVDETWITNVPVPRGISEIEVARLTPFPARYVEPPCIDECPINMECVVEFTKEFQSHLIVFLRVLGTWVDEDLLRQDRLALMRRFPAYECDDIRTKWGGALERLSVLEELCECPTYPVGPQEGRGGTFADWMAQLEADGHLSAAEHRRTMEMDAIMRETQRRPNDPARERTRRHLTAVLRAITQQRWDEVHQHLRAL